MYKARQGSSGLAGVVAQLVERLFRIQEAWGSTPHCSIFFNPLLQTHPKPSPVDSRGRHWAGLHVHIYFLILTDRVYLI